MLSRVLGVILILASVILFILNTFLYLNSSAYFDYNKEVMSLSEAGVFFPYFFAALFFIFGNLLWRNKILTPKNH